MNWQWTSLPSIQELNREEFDQLTADETTRTPFLRYEYLCALEQTQCVDANANNVAMSEKNTDWQVSHIVIRNNDQQLVAFIPAYIKYDSYGEFVFDHSWAHAYHQHQLAYYPKLVMAVPFTPVSGARVLLNPKVDADLSDVAEYLANISQDICRALDISSIHCLFPENAYSEQLKQNGYHQRSNVQFHWRNQAFTSFEHYLDSFTTKRRRSVRKERKNIDKQGVTTKRILGREVNSEQIDFFYRCYQQTYLKRSGHEGYLNLRFFEQLFETMPDNLLLVIAYKEDTMLACALFFCDQYGLFGRYWGSVLSPREAISGLHFEVCYYQGIEFCIEQNIKYFNPGTQGEHKILRGFAPTFCYSNHKMREKAFDDAVADFVTQEHAHIKEYAKDAATLLPFKVATD